MNRFLRTAFLAAAASALALPVAAQPAAEPAEQPTFREAIDVRVVNVEVVVTDRQGNRVTGLGPEDLLLTVDGEQVPIDYFTEVRGGVAVAAEGSGEAAVPGVAALAPGDPVPTSYLVFIDDWYPIARDRDHVLRALVDDLPDLGPADRMAVVAFDGRRAELLSSWTDSRSELERVFAEAMERPTSGFLRAGEERSFETARPPGPGRFNDWLGSEQTMHARHLETRVERVVDAAVTALRGFAQPSGRKVMLLLSGGWPLSPAGYVVDDLRRTVVAYDGAGSELYAPLTDTANLLGYTLYPVDVPGLAGVFPVDSARGDDPVLGAVSGYTPLGEADPVLGIATPGISEAPLLAQSPEKERQVHATLSLLADETGGRPLINAGRNDALAEVAADTRSYYWIGFTPGRPVDDAFHDVQVEAAGPGLEVRTRAGYRDLSPEVENDMAVDGALLFGDARTGGSLAVSVGDPMRDGRRFIELPVTLTIPTEAMTLVPEGGELVARFELRVAALGEDERKSDVQTVPIELRFGEAPPADGVLYETRLRLRNQEHDVVVALHDPISGADLTTRLAVAPAGR